MQGRRHVEEILLTVNELAQMLSINRSSVYRQLAKGRIPPPIRFGRSVRWNQWHVQEWLDAGAPPMSEWLNSNGGAQ